MKKLRKSILFLGLILISSWTYAQQGPELPCPECKQDYVKPTPYEGSWFNPEQSGSGFLIEVENDKLLGYYFGYDDEGEPIWALFNGQLQDASDQGSLWKVNSTLSKFIGGNCVNCTYKPPSHTEDIGEIEIVFNRHAHASFSIGGGEVQNIIPLYFGFETIDHFKEQTAFPIPELEGWWTVFVDENLDIPEVYTYINYMIHLSKGGVDNDGRLSFYGVYYPNPPEAIDGGAIICELDSNTNLSQIKCSISIALIDQFFYLDLADISSDRIYGESPFGDTIEMIRLGSDYCPSPSSPKYCINTGVFDYLDD